MSQSRSISTRFSLALIAALAAVLALFAVVAVLVAVNRSEAELKRVLSGYLNVSAVALRVPIWNLDFDAAAGVAESLMRDERVAFAEIVLDGTSVATFRHEALGEIEYRQLRERADYMVDRTDVVFDDEVIGTLRLGVSRAAVRDAVMLNIAGILFLTLLIIAAVAVTSFWMSRRLIGRPLRRLQAAASRIAEGDLEARIGVDREDEMGRLARDLDAMRSAIRGLVGKLQGANEGLEEANRTLEHRVAARTAELSAARDDIADARRRLLGAIESITEGFAFYDSEDRLVLGNTRFHQLLSGSDEGHPPGTPFETIIRGAVAAGRVASAEDDPERWIGERLAARAELRRPELVRFGKAWVQISERRIEGGGTVTVYTDLTELKERERKLDDANRLILDSIRYASRIQTAVLPAHNAFAAATRDHFLLWEPRDMVGGDFFWFHPLEDGYALIVGDCTGHGVPGAFMTLIATGLLDRLLSDGPLDQPSRLLSDLHKGLQILLGQDQAAGDTDDGLELGICFVRDARREVTFSGARFSLWQSEAGEVREIKGNKAGIGHRRVPLDASFSDVVVPFRKETAFYLTTDGLIDQIGGPQQRSFGKRRFAAFLADQEGVPMDEQATRLRETMTAYQGAQRRRDDVTVLGFAPRLIA
ncbi:MAG: SpoIIE family protein phosphatase [Pseudomonadota bacterium]